MWTDRLFWEAMTTADEPPESLISALAKARIPADNHEFIQRMTDAIGIATYRAVAKPDKPYIKAKRLDGRRELHIYHGYTNGFASKDEIVAAMGTGAGCGLSTRKPTWFVKHPLTNVHPGGERSLSVGREADKCDTCHQLMPLTGVCDNCD
jgi:hypothetical protein